MNGLKKILGLLWLIIGPVCIYFLVDGAFTHIDPDGKHDINNPLVWVIIILIFTPIAIGLMIFGWYAWKGEYEHLPEDSDDLAG